MADDGRMYDGESGAYAKLIGGDTWLCCNWVYLDRICPAGASGQEITFNDNTILKRKSGNSAAFSHVIKEILSEWMKNQE